MRIFAWIAFIAIIIGGFVGSIPFWENNPVIGFLLFVGGFIAAFISVALIMVILDMAVDVKVIRNNMQNKDK